MTVRMQFKTVLKRLQEERRFIQVLLGPRQVGKTTLVLKIAEEIHKPCYYVSADLATLQDLNWIRQQWEIARLKINSDVGAVLIIDEVQKIPHWSDLVKSLWDYDSRQHINLSMIILSSSPWLMQKGMSESLAGRFEVIPMTHWSYKEMQETFGFSVKEYVYFGGYPGARTPAKSPHSPFIRAKVRLGLLNN